MKIRDAVKGFHLLENMFYFVYEIIIFHLNKGKDDILQLGSLISIYKL